MTTEELLQKCRKKDRTAWDEFAKRYRHLVAKSVGYKIKTLKTPSSRNEIADIIQDIFLAIWEKDKLDEVKDPATLESWLAIMSINMASNHFKKRSLRHFQDAVSIEKTLTIENRRTTLGEVLTSPDSDLNKILVSNELKAALEKELSKFGTKQQLALKFFIYEQERIKDISQIMDLPIGTVSSLIRRGQEILRKKLKKLIES